MSYRKIFWGVMLVLIGTLFILKNVGVIYFDWVTIWRLWPLILILWGISLIPVKDYLKLIFSVAAIGLSILLVNRYDKTGYYSFGFRDHGPHIEWDDSRDYNGDDVSQEMFQPLDSALTRVELKLEAAAGDFRINQDQPEDKLLTFEKHGNVGNYSMTSRDEDSTRFIDLKIKESNVRIKNRGNRVKIGLNPNPVWNFDLDIGAANVDFDLSPYKVEKLKLDGGAASMKIKLGDLSDLTNVKIDAGAASIDIRIPEGAGAEIDTDTALTSRNFKGFDKVKNGLYRTPGFDNASKKFYIEIDAAVSSLNIERY